jgi:ABC-2 type transport system ATP-binding protein
VVYHGSITQLRAQAPDPAHHLRTSDDPAATEIAGAHPGVAISAHAEGGLTLRAPQDEVDGYVISLGTAKIAIRSLQLDVAPLESLFFMLTEADPPESAPVAAPPALTGATR